MNPCGLVAHFNYSRSERRLKNLLRFLERMKHVGLPLCALEAALPGDQFDLNPCESVLQVTTPEPMFNKENFINVLLRRVPKQYDAIFWMDSDYLPRRDDIVQATLEKLTQHKIVQMYSSILWEGPEGQLGPFVKGGRAHALGIVARNDQLFPEKRDVNPVTAHVGFAWAARRDVLEKIGGLYDAYPAGTGDAFSAIGFYGDFDCLYLKMNYDKPVRQHVLAWARKAFEVVQADLGFVDDQPIHAYHGHLHDRCYVERHLVLRSFGFDPAKHVRYDKQGLLEYTEECPEAIRGFMKKYMTEMRREG